MLLSLVAPTVDGCEDRSTYRERLRTGRCQAVERHGRRPGQTSGNGNRSIHRLTGQAATWGATMGDRSFAMTPLTRVTFDPEVMGGKPCIRGLLSAPGALTGVSDL